MRWNIRTVLCLTALLLILPSCSHNPRMLSGTESDYLLKLRAEYLASNPNGMYNEYVERGEVVKGMDFLEVLASWGHPEIRKKESSLTEQWTYTEVDEASKDWVVYVFTFRRNVLSEWDLYRHFAAGGQIDLPQGRASTSLTRGDYAGTSGTDSGTPKKR
jgi:hypothetical protein